MIKLLPCKSCGSKMIMKRFLGGMFPYCQYRCCCGLEINGKASDDFTSKETMEASAREEWNRYNTINTKKEEEYYP
jgi:hypothetical protein